MPESPEDAALLARATCLPPLRAGAIGPRFPSMLPPAASMLLGTLYQLEASQWWPAGQLHALQLKALGRLLEHAWQTCPGYRPRLESAGFRSGIELDESLWQRLPVLERAQLQEHESALTSTALPQGHGKVKPVQSSGSTGRPVRALATELTGMFWQVATLRDHLWHRRDFSLPMMGLRPDRGRPDANVRRHASWGPPVEMLFESGPSVLVNSREDIDRQITLLLEHRPGYVLSMPSNLRALAHEVRRRGIALDSLRGIRSFAENLSSETRELLVEVFGVPVTDMYTATEVGYMALQCPAGSWHVQSETLRLEVLDESGRPCATGVPGRVVVTPLHNFALPLIRYAVGDYAQWGGPCSCGRGLPVLSRVLGRSRGMARTPDGRQFWPSFPSEAWLAVADIRQIQLTQVALDRIDVRYVSPVELDAAQLARLTANLQDSLGHPFALHYTRVESIPLQGNGKYEDFISALPG
jgi:phenylacetate-CoA ligase